MRNLIAQTIPPRFTARRVLEKIQFKKNECVPEKFVSMGFVQHRHAQINATKYNMKNTIFLS